MVASGLDRLDQASYSLKAYEIRHATYVALGVFEREIIELPLVGSPLGSAKATIELVTLPGPLALDARARTRWITAAATAVADFWHGFPVAHAMLAVVPAAGRESIAHGKVVATGGASLLIQLGSEATEPQLYDDWILVHELFHLGFPSFLDEGKWLDEGLATYYEPIIRARAGWSNERAVWRELATDMPQGLGAVESLGIEREKIFAGMYWGGAILALMADVRARESSGGKLGLEDGLRAVLEAGGNATRVWTLDQVVRIVDARLGGPVLGDLSRAHGHRGRPVDLEGLFRRLGVMRTEDGIELDDGATGAAIRRAIVSPRAATR